MQIPDRLAKLYGREYLQKLATGIMAGGREAFERNRFREAEMIGTLEALSTDMGSGPRAHVRRGPRTINPDKSPIQPQQAPAASVATLAAPPPIKPPAALKVSAKPLTAAQLEKAQGTSLYAKLWPTKAKGAAALSAEEKGIYAKVHPDPATAPEPLATNDQDTWAKAYGQSLPAQIDPSDDALYRKAYVKGPSN